MKKLFGIILILPFLGWIALRIVLSIQFDITCGGHMKRAADANSVQLAVQEMRVVMDYLESKKLTGGYTSIFYRTPDEDIGFWYNNMKSSLEELMSLKPEASSLEKSNVLMKLRETLADHGQSMQITVPSGISVYPGNAALMVLGSLTAILAIAGAVLFFYYLDY